MYNPKVSVVIPVYNGSNFLEQAIESALAQTYQNIEIIVVNDGSNDDGATAQVAARYADKIRYFEKENGGSSSAINRGIQEMTGEWFSWLSHDDLYMPDKVEKEIGYMHDLGLSEGERNRTIFFSGSELINEHGATLKRDREEVMKAMEQEVNFLKGSEYLVAQPRKFNFHGCSCLVHRSVFEKVGLFDEKLRILNDVEMWFRIYSEGYTMRYVPEVLVKGRIHAKQVGRSIGYSAQHPESDMLWKRRIDWLWVNCPQNYEAFFLIGKAAFLSGRKKDGERALDIAKSISPEKKTELFFRKGLYRLYAAGRTAAKNIFIKLKL